MPVNDLGKPPPPLEHPSSNLVISKADQLQHTAAVAPLFLLSITEVPGFPLQS